MDLFPLSSRKKISLCFLNLQLDKLCVSHIDSLEYSGANKVKMSTVASDKLQRKKLVKGKAEVPPGALSTRDPRSPLPYKQDMSLFQPCAPMQSRHDLRPAVFSILTAR